MKTRVSQFNDQSTFASFSFLSSVEVMVSVSPPTVDVA